MHNNKVLNVVIIIPTYNERNNIGRLINAIQELPTIISHVITILVVDDNSPDETSNIVLEAQKKYSNIFLLQGKKEGLGAAYIRGMLYAMDHLKADLIFEMDADFSHDPNDIPRLISAAEEGADFVIGSRYVKGGNIPNNWGLIRSTNSKFGNLVARYVAGLYSIKDCTAGFRAIKVSTLRKIHFDKLKVRGYAFQVALLHQAKMLGANIKEVPVRFVDRTHGVSKLGIRDIFEFILNAWWIRFQSSKTFIKFSIVGLSGTIINLVSFYLLIDFGINKFISSPLAIEISIIFNFILNNAWTFRWRSKLDSLGFRGLKFNTVSIAALGISYSTFVTLSLVYPHQNPTLHQLIGIAPAMLFNYFMNTYWTFRNKATV